MKRAISILKKAGINLLVLLVLLELGLRLGGWKSKTELEQPFAVRHKVERLKEDASVDTSERLISFLKPDSALTWRLVNGRFRLENGKGFEFTMEHRDGKRITSKYKRYSTQQNLAFFGCSYTYGLGLDDSLSFPFRVQQRMPEWTVHNFGVPGYGTFHCLSYMKEELARHTFEKVFYFYIEDHDQRNALLYQHRIAKYFSLKSHFQDYLAYLSLHQLSIDDIKFSQYYLDENDSMAFNKIPFGELYTELPLAEHSRTLYQLEKLINTDSKKEQEDAPELTARLLKQMQKLCEQKQTDFYFVGLGKSARSEALIRFCEEQGIKTCYLNIDLAPDSMRLYPHDNHPNGQANLLIADFLEQELKRILTVKEPEL